MSKTGKITQLIGAVVDVRFDDDLPEIYTALEVNNGGNKLILEELLPKNISTQVFKAFLENAASEQGSRMTAMDNATRNAGDLVDKLTINYNRSRQAAITKELIEIISGAESL